MANTSSINTLIVDEKQTIVATGAEIIDLDAESRPKRDIGIDDTEYEDPEAPADPTNMGDPGETHATPSVVEKDPVTGRTIVIVRRKERMAITDFSDGFIQDCIDEGAQAIAVFKDGTERVVQWSEIFNPYGKAEQVTLNIGEIASATNQHFWTDDNGAHATDERKVDWTNEYQKENHGTLSDPTLSRPWHNILLNSLGILLRRGLINLAGITRGSIAFYDGVANDASNIVALFGSDGAQIGKTTENHLVIDSNSINVYDGSGNLIPLHASNIDADHAVIENLDTNYAHITDGVIDNATIGHADVNGLNANYAHLNNGVIDNAKIGHADVNGLSANYAHMTEGVIDNAKIGHADVNGLNANYAHMTEGVIDNAKIGHADVNGLNANYAHLNNGVIDNATINHANVNGLNAAYAHITNGSIDNATIDYANVTDLNAHYAQIDLANVNNAWVENGIIKDGAIVNAQIHDVSANKLTAGTIDASVITVTNLTAEDIAVRRINGQLVNDKTLVDALSQHETDISDLDSKIDDAVDDLNGRIDAQIQTYTSTDVPTLNNYPASDWNTNDLKNEHVGDILYVLNAGAQADGYTYRFAYDRTNNVYQWVLIKDNQVTAALQRLVDAEGDISDLQTFESSTNTWRNTTDDTISTIQSNQTTMSGQISNLESTKVDSTTFNSLSATVGENTSKITNLTTTVNTLDDDIDNLDGRVTTVSNTVNSVQQTTNSNSSAISNLTQRLGTAANGTEAANDIVNRVSSINQDLTGFKTTVSETYATKNALAAEINHRKAVYAVSNTGSNVAAKVADCSDFELYTGVTVSCVFANSNQAEAPTLNINGTGAKPIRSYVGAPLSEAGYSWAAGSVLDLVYDGTSWRIQDGGSTERLYHAETSILQNAEAIELRATKTEVEEISSAVSTLSSEDFYSHTYEQNGNMYHFIASLHQGGVDVTNAANPMRFIWYLKNENTVELAGRGITFDVSGTKIGYRGSIIGAYEDANSQDALIDNTGRQFVTDTGDQIIANVIWED